MYAYSIDHSVKPRSQSKQWTLAFSVPMINKQHCILSKIFKTYLLKQGAMSSQKCHKCSGFISKSFYSLFKLKFDKKFNYSDANVTLEDVLMLCPQISWYKTPAKGKLLLTFPLYIPMCPQRNSLRVAKVDSWRE